MKYLKKYNVFENNEIDYSGEYSDLYNFIFQNSLQKLFVDKYSKQNSNLTIDNWEDFVRGELGVDEEIIEELLDKNYRIRYDDDNDEFIITKYKKAKIKDYIIVQTNDYKVNDILDDSGIYSEFKPRFAVLVNNKIIGGSTYIIDDDNVYNFDIGIMDRYQGYGISKKLIDKIITDAKKLKTKGLKAHVVNNTLFDYLGSIGFNLERGEMKYAYFDFNI